MKNLSFPALGLSSHNSRKRCFASFWKYYKTFLQILKAEIKLFSHFGQFQVYLGDITLTAFLNTFSSVDFYGIKSLCKPIESNVYITDAYGSAKSVRHIQMFAMQRLSYKRELSCLGAKKPNVRGSDTIIKQGITS